MTLSLPRGTTDLGPADAITLKGICAVVEEVYKRFGFYPIETPAIELMETLNVKAYGEDSKNEIYVIEGGEEGLRYDFTVPLARFIAMNKDLQMPFKRYQIGRIWRMDEPQKMRHREFLQADLDVIGSADVSSDAEVIAATAIALEMIGVEAYTLLINSRIFLNAILNMFKIPEDKHGAVIRCIDKMEKIGAMETSAQITKLGVENKAAQALIDFLKTKNDNAELLNTLKIQLPEIKPEIERMEELLLLLARHGIRGKITVDLSLARGFDYYTGAVWEFVAYAQGERLPTLASGGRYDRLIGIYAKKELPAVGSSVGISRVFDALKNGSVTRTYAKVYLAPIKKDNLAYAINIATALRSAGIYVDMNLTQRNIAKQMEYANSLRIPFVAIVGNMEMEANKIKLRNMQTGEEAMLTAEECIIRLMEK